MRMPHGKWKWNIYWKVGLQLLCDGNWEEMLKQMFEQPNLPPSFLSDFTNDLSQVVSPISASFPQTYITVFIYLTNLYWMLNMGQATMYACHTERNQHSQKRQHQGKDIKHLCRKRKTQIWLHERPPPHPRRTLDTWAFVKARHVLTECLSSLNFCCCSNGDKIDLSSEQWITHLKNTRRQMTAISLNGWSTQISMTSYDITSYFIEVLLSTTSVLDPTLYISWEVPWGIIKGTPLIDQDIVGGLPLVLISFG